VDIEVIHRTWGSREDTEQFLGRDVGDMVVWKAGDFTAGPASGSYQTRGMIIVPATTAVIAGVAAGISKDLIQTRCRRHPSRNVATLYSCPGRTPVRPSTLRQMADLAAEGAVILPASPGFYAGAKDVCELVDFIAAKVLDVIGVPHTLSRRWAGQLGVATDSPHD